MMLSQMSAGMQHIRLRRQVGILIHSRASGAGRQGAARQAVQQGLPAAWK